MFSILGLQKLKDRGALAKRASHHLRGHLVANANPERAHLNTSSWTKSADDLVDRIWKKTAPAMQRKDGVRVLELMLTASPEWFEKDPDPKSKVDRLKELHRGARAFVSETFGLENVVAMGMHRDERSPHIWVFVTPIFEGKLRANRWVDGPEKLSKLHDDWAAKMAPFGLERGAKKSGAKHIDIRTYYTAVNGDKSAQETISREMSRRAVRAKKRAETAENKAAEIEAREATSKAIFESLSVVEQERAQELFLRRAATNPLPAVQKPPVGRSGKPIDAPKSSKSLRNHPRP